MPVLEPGCMCMLTFSVLYYVTNLSLSLSLSFFHTHTHTPQKLEALLPARPDGPLISDDMEEVNMMEYEGTRGGEDGHREAYDESDDEDGGIGQRIGCSHQ